MHEPIKPIMWAGGSDGVLQLLDQTLLPDDVRYLDIADAAATWEAIKLLRVRGAPAIGIAAAFGLYLAVRNSTASTYAAFRAEIDAAVTYLASARPTAVNLTWALQRIAALVEQQRDLPVAALKEIMLDEAHQMIDEDNRVCRAIGQHGAALLAQNTTILTHCNAGGLATAQWGTALAVVYVAAEQGKTVHVFADETRPLLQGARLTAWELQQAGVPVTLITDSMAATVLARGSISAVIVGTDRVAANGDVANKIGTLGVAVLAKEFGVPFYVAAPLSSIDMQIASGADIPIEERAPEEIIAGFGRRTAPDGVAVYNPAFDVTPHRYVSALITEAGIVRPPFEQGLRTLFAHQGRTTHAS